MPPLFVASVFIIDGLWVLWIAYWFFSAFNTKRAVYKQPLGQRLTFLTILVVGVVLIMKIPTLRERFFSVNLPTQIAGILLVVAGLAFAVWARVHLGKNWSGWVALKQDHELIQSGPYRLARHPIYTGVLIAIVGTMLALLPSIGGICAIALALAALFYKIRQEEALMLQQFPDQYPAYKSRVKALIPFVL